MSIDTMTQAALTIDRILSRQALITGRVHDALTGQPTLSPATVGLFYQTPAGEPTRPYPLAIRLRPGGLFVAAGDPERTFPTPQPGQTLALRLTASAPGYRTASVDFGLTAAALTPADQVRQIAGQDVTMRLLSAPLASFEIALSPEPVHLSGRVVRADDPEVPIRNALVRTIQPARRGPVRTDADGFFTLLDLPVAVQVTVRVSRAGFTTLDRTMTLDYRQPVNQQTFALSS